jgi:hypothetical protein
MGKFDRLTDRHSRWDLPFFQFVQRKTEDISFNYPNAIPPPVVCGLADLIIEVWRSDRDGYGSLLGCFKEANPTTIPTHYLASYLLYRRFAV